MQNWKFLIRNFDDVSDVLIADRDLLKLDIYILAPSYLGEGRPHFTKKLEDNNQEPNKNAAQELMVSDSEEEAMKKRTIHKKMRDTEAVSFAVACFSGCLLVTRSSTLSGSAVLISRSSILPF